MCEHCKHRNKCRFKALIKGVVVHFCPDFCAF